MMIYPKIETLYNRDNKTFKVKEDEIRYPEFENILEWEVSEKIHGMNIRIIYEPILEKVGVISTATMLETKGRRIRFFGRTDKAQLPKHLIKYLEEIFTVKSFENTFPDIEEFTRVTMFGEGYGYKINNGSNYVENEGVKLRVFDIFIEDHENPLGGWWLESENIKDICDKFGIDTVPILGMLEIEQITRMIKDWKHSTNGYSVVQMYDNGNCKTDIVMEGLVARTKPLLFTRRGKRLMFKLKVKDFGQ